MYITGLDNTTETLFIINKKAGTGYGKGFIEKLIQVANDKIGPKTLLKIAVVANHEQAIMAVQSFLIKNKNSKIIIVGGGGGTLSAVINGIYKDKGRFCLVTLVVLRMGSGNVLAKRLGAPADPSRALNIFGEKITSLNTIEVCITRYEFVDRDNIPNTRYGATLMGLSQMGCVPGDIARFHKRFPLLYRILARTIGIEILNNIEYAGFLFLRLLACCLNLIKINKIQLNYGYRKSKIMLLAGLAMNFPIKAIPIDPGLDIHNNRISIKLIPYKDRLNTISLLFSPSLIRKSTLNFFLNQKQELEILFDNEKATEFFIDEDPFFVKEKLKISIARSLNFFKFSALHNTPAGGKK